MLLLEQVSAKYLKEYNQSGQVLIKNWKEKYFRVIENDDGEERLEEFKDIPENRLDPLKDFEARSVRTNVFFMRVFLGKSRKEVAETLGIPEDTVSFHFTHAKKRAVRVLEALNGHDAAVLWAKNTPRKLTERQKWFILYKVFGLTYKQVKKICPDVPQFKTFSADMRRREKRYLGACDRHMAGAA